MKVGARYVAEISTAGRPAEAVAAATRDLADGPYVIEVSVAHDEGCPCTESGEPMMACTCEIVSLEGTRVA